MPANNPNPGKKVSSLSNANATPVDAMGGRDAPLQETYEEAVKNVENQAPNRTATWAVSQQPRSDAMSGPRFEQTIMEMQVSFKEYKFLWVLRPWIDSCAVLGGRFR